MSRADQQVKRVKAKRSLRAWRQSDLSNDCGLVGSINLLRTVLASPPLPRRACESLYGLGADYLHRRGSLRAIIKGGMHDHQLWTLLRFLCSQVERQHKVSLKLQRPFWKRTKPIPLREFATFLAQFLARPGTGSIISYESHWHCHFTVVRAVTASSLVLSDGDQSRLPLRSCSMTALAPKLGQHYLLDPFATILLSADVKAAAR